MKKIVLSFDDGFEENYTVVYPYLKKKGIKTTTFLSTNDLGKRGFLDWDQIKEMIKDGWDFQCHTHNHIMLDKVSDEEIEREIMLSKNEFTQRTLPHPEYFAYPYGVNNERIINIIKKHFKGARSGANAKGGDYDMISYGLHGKHDFEKLAEKDVLLVHTHDIRDDHRGFGVTVSEFKKFIEFFLSKGFEFITFKELFEGVPKKKDKKAVIMGAGSSTRWGDYMGVPKQLIEVEGEPIIKRTIRLLRENGINEIYVTVPKKGYYGKLDAKEIIGSSENEINKFLNAKQHAGAVFLWGDCYFSKHAIKTICANEEDLMFFGNPGRNKYTGKPWGEIFAVKTNDLFFEKVIELERHKDEMIRCASWELYGLISKGQIFKNRFTPHKKTEEGLSVPNPEKTKEHFTEIYDFTDDFDYPRDYDNWILRYNHYQLKPAWDKPTKTNFTVSYNIMAHKSREKYVSYLQKKLGKDAKVIWDKKNNIWDTRKMCLEDHIKQGKDFGITVQDDAVLCENFREKAERFINQIGEKEAVYNFFYMMSRDTKKIGLAIENGENYIKNNRAGITNEVTFAFPTHLMKDMIKTCDSSNETSKYIPKECADADWVMDERYVKQKEIRCYYSVPSLVDHRVDIKSLYFPNGTIKDEENRRAWWFYGETQQEKVRRDGTTKHVDGTISFEKKDTIQSNGTMDVVYMIDTRSHSKPLPLSVMTLKNIPYRAVYVVGKAHPKIKTEVINIQDTEKEPLANIIKKIEAVITDSRISEDFILMNDDFFILQEYKEIPYYHQGKISEYKPNAYFARAKEVLQERFPEGKMFNVHFPIVFNKTKLKELLQKEDKNAIISSDLRSYYCNFHNIEGEYHTDHKMRKKADIAVHKDAPFFSTSNLIENTRLLEIEKILKKRL